MSRTHRRPYTGSRAVSRECRGKGKCPWCVGNRTHKHYRAVHEGKTDLRAGHFIDLEV